MRASSNPLTSSPPLSRGQRGTILPLVLVGVYVLLMWVGYWLLRQSGVMVEGQDLSYDRAMFLSVNAATLTGFQQAIGTNEFNPNSAQGPAIVLVLTVSGSLFALIVGGLAGARALRLAYSDLQVVTAAIVAELLAILAGTAAQLAGGMELFDAAQKAACAFGNSGVITFSKVAQAAGPHALPVTGPGAWQTHAVLLPLAVLGGLGLPVLMELYDAIFGSRLSYHSRTVLSLTAGVYLGGMILLFLCQAMQEPLSTPGAWRSTFAMSSAAALDARTAGLPLDMVSRFSRAAQWALVLLMAIGASPAGTAGGIKTTTFHQLFNGIRDALRGRRVQRSTGIAAAWLAIYLLIVIVGLLLMVTYEAQLPADRCLFQVVSAVSNVGLSHDPVSTVGPALYMLALLMLLGRLAPLCILWWLALTTPDADVLVG